MKRKLMRGLAFTVVALVGLVPIQASPAAADPEKLDVTLNGFAATESIARAAGTIQWVTATLNAAAAAPRDVRFDTNGSPTSFEESCSIATGATSCSVDVTQAGTGKMTIRGYVEDFDPTTVPPTHRPCGVAIPPTLPEDCDSTEAVDSTTTAGAGNTTEPDDTDVVEVDWYVSQLQLTEPVTVTKSAPVNITATLTAKGITPVKGLVGNIDGEIISGPNKDKTPNKADMECNTVLPAGTCTLTYTAGATSGVDEVQGWLDKSEDDKGTAATTDDTGDETNNTGGAYGSHAMHEGDDTEAADENATPGEGGTAAEQDNTDNILVNISDTPVLTIAPASQTKTTAETATVTVSLTTGATPTNNQKIAAVVLSGGPNAGKVLTCTTGPGGTCALTPALSSTTTGTDKIRATVDNDGNGQPNEADQTEDVGTQGGTPEPDTTAVASVTWTSTTPDPDPDPDDNDACEQAKKDVRRAKKQLKKAKNGGDDDKIAKAKKKLKKAKKKKKNACG